jgi:hypothetical protein
LVRVKNTPEGMTWRVQRLDGDPIRHGEFYTVPPHMLHKLGWEPVEPAPSPR